MFPFDNWRAFVARFGVEAEMFAHEGF